MDADEPGSFPPQPPRKRSVGFVRELALAMELPFILVGGVLLGGALGRWIDLRANTTPLFTFLLGLLGFAAGIREVIRRIPKNGNQDDA